MAEDEGIHVSSVVHEALLEVNELGATAAAAASCNVKSSCLVKDLQTFRVDRPFLAAILKEDSALFFGRVVDPAETRY